jgi:cytochrome c oxidase subunit 2
MVLNRMRLPLFALALAATVSTAPASEPAIRTFDVVASRFAFQPDVLEVHEGDRVVLRLRSVDTDHGFSVKEFKVKTTVPKTGEPVSVEFLATRPGTFRFECSQYCGKGHSRMNGQLIVHPRQR